MSFLALRSFGNVTLHGHGTGHLVTKRSPVVRIVGCCLFFGLSTDSAGLSILRHAEFMGTSGSFFGVGLWRSERGVKAYVYFKLLDTLLRVAPQTGGAAGK